MVCLDFQFSEWSVQEMALYGAYDYVIFRDNDLNELKQVQGVCRVL